MEMEALVLTPQKYMCLLEITRNNDGNKFNNVDETDIMGHVCLTKIELWGNRNPIQKKTTVKTTKLEIKIITIIILFSKKNPRPNGAIVEFYQTSTLP